MNVFVLPMPVIIEGQAYYEGIDLLPDQFFRALTERQAVSTSPAVSRRCDGPLG